MARSDAQFFSSDISAWIGTGKEEKRAKNNERSKRRYHERKKESPKRMSMFVARNNELRPR